MSFLFIFFLITDFSRAQEIKIETFTDESNFPASKIDKTIRIKELVSNNISLKNIPRTKVSDAEKNLIKNRNPFSPLGSDPNSNSESSIASIIFKGIVKIGDSKVVFAQTPQGPNTFEVGQEISGGFKISNIDEDKLTIEISDDKVTHTINLGNDEK